MDRHFSHSLLLRLLSGNGSEERLDTPISHIAQCERCWRLAARVLRELPKVVSSTESQDARAALLILMDNEKEHALGYLRARGSWAELRDLPSTEQLDRLEEDGDLRTAELFHVLIEEAASQAPSDPHLAEETALLAHALAGLLPTNLYPDPVRCDLQSKALLAVANGRRLMADWQGSLLALNAAGHDIKRGTGAPQTAARLLSIKASLASDTGHLEEALRFLRGASLLYQKEREPSALASIAVQEASVLLAAGRYAEAVGRAEEALGSLAPTEARLELLARSIIIECLLLMGEADEAVRNFNAIRPLYDQFGGRRTELQVGYLEALILDALGYVREAEKRFRSNASDRIEAELYKDAFLTMLTHFEALRRRGAWKKAASVCVEALKLLETNGAGRHSQIAQVWRGLLALVHARALGSQHLLEARTYLVRHWNSPSRVAPFMKTDTESHPLSLGESIDASELEGEEVLEPGRGENPPDEPALDGSLWQAMEQVDRKLVERALLQCNGSAREVSRLLGLSRNTLRMRMKRYGLDPNSGMPALSSPRVPAEQEEFLSRLRVRAWWGELKESQQPERLDKVRSVKWLKTRRFLEFLLEEASQVAQEDPLLGEEIATLAYEASSLVRAAECSELKRNDFRCEALLCRANCNRLTGKWQAAAFAIDAAEKHFQAGNRESRLRVRLLSIKASLLGDTGQRDQALKALSEGALAARRSQDESALVSLLVQEASILLSAARYEDALDRAEQSLEWVSGKNGRLGLLARGIMTESLIHLDRPEEALISFHAARNLFSRFGGVRTTFQLGYLEALLLDALGYAREAESAFRINIADRIAAGHYKDAFLTMLTRFAMFYRRDELAAAVAVCEEAIDLINREGADWHEPVRELWHDLLALVSAKQLTEERLLVARQELVAHLGAGTMPEGQVASEASPVQRASAFLPPPLPALPEVIDKETYEKTLDLYEREFIAAALKACQGKFKEMCQVLSIAPHTLRARMRRYGLRLSRKSLN